MIARMGAGASPHYTAQQTAKHTLPLTLLLAVVGAAAGAIYAVWLGQDQNWDWHNYHFYSVLALMEGRFLEDVHAAGIQTYLNPVLYLPQYLLREHLSPIVAAAALGALQGLNVPLIWLISCELIRGDDSSGRDLQLLATVIGATGAATLSEVGTSFADVLTSMLVLTGLYLVLRSTRDEIPGFMIGAGLFVGIALGLKLTNAIFAIGIGAAVAVGRVPFRQSLHLALGGVCGALLAGGPWALFLWREFGSPTFPFYNDIFRAPDAPPLSFADLRFLPSGIYDALLYPFYWLAGVQITTEIPMRDARFAVAFFLLVVLALGCLFSQESENRRIADDTKKTVVFGTFFLISYIVWLLQFSIHRYMVVLEMLCGVAVILLLQAIFVRRFAVPAGALLTIGIIAWTQPPDWGRYPWSAPPSVRLPERLKQPSAVFLLDKPLAYLAAYLHLDSRLYRLGDLPIRAGGRFDSLIKSALHRQWPGGAWAVYYDGARPESAIRLLEAYGVAVETTGCAVIQDGLFGDPVACPIKRL